MQGNGFTSTATDFTICVWFLIYYVVGILASISICIVALIFKQKIRQTPFFSSYIYTFSHCFNFLFYFSIVICLISIFQRKPNPLFSYCLQREGKSPTCTSFSNLHHHHDIIIVIVVINLIIVTIISIINITITSSKLQFPQL